jgi:hypothetical protein
VFLLSRTPDDRQNPIKSSQEYVYCTVKFTDSRLSQRFAVDIGSVLSYLTRVDVGNIADVSGVYSASVLRQPVMETACTSQNAYKIFPQLKERRSRGVINILKIEL